MENVSESKKNGFLWRQIFKQTSINQNGLFDIERNFQWKLLI